MSVETVDAGVRLAHRLEALVRPRENADPARQDHGRLVEFSCRRLQLPSRGARTVGTYAAGVGAKGLAPGNGAVP